MESELTPEDAQALEQSEQQEAENDARLETSPEENETEESTGEAQEEEEKEKPALDVEAFNKLQTNYDNLSRALAEERNTRKEFRTQLEEKEKLMQRMEERFQKIQARFQQEEVPDAEENPLGHLMYQQEQLRKRMEEFDNRAKTQDRTSEQQQYVTAITSQMSTLESAFHQATPDYYDAVKFMREIRDRDYQSMGISDPVERAQMVNNDAFYIVQNALAKNQNAAEVIYNIARNYGYKVPEASPDNKARIEQQKKAVEQNRSLGSKGTSPVGPSLRQLSNMSDEEFAALSDDEWERMWTQ